ncbi:putative protein OS=Bosea thiooxidans OX=53254 GN=ARD30_18690 PE=4 SV=1 [Bosea thiooxidans]
MQAQADHAAVQDKAQSLEQALAAAQAELAELRRANKEEIVVLQNAQRERESQVEMLRAELRTLEGALSQAREDRDQLLDEMSGLRRAAAGAGGSNAALRQEITRLADRLMSLAPSREAAE